MNDEMMAKVAGQHNKALTTFELLVPDEIGTAKTLPEEVECLRHPSGAGVWACYTWSDVKNNEYLYDSYKKILENYRIECGEYDDSRGFEYVWFFICETLSKGLRHSGKAYPVGVFAITKDTTLSYIPVYTAVWIHPYLRNQGVVSGLLRYLLSEKLYIPEPPVSMEMNFVIQSVFKSFDDENRKRLDSETHACFEKMYGVSLTGLDEREKVFVMTLIPKIGKDKQNQNTIDTFVGLIRNEQVVEQLKNISLEGVDQHQMAKEMFAMDNEAYMYKSLSDKN